MSQDSFNKSETEDYVVNESFSSFVVEQKSWQRFKTPDDSLSIKGQTLNILDGSKKKKDLPKNENKNDWLLLIQEKYNNLVKKISRRFEDSIGTKIKSFFNLLSDVIQNIKFKIQNITDDLKDKANNILQSVFVKVKQLLSWKNKKSVEEVEFFEDKQSEAQKRNFNDKESVSSSVKKIFG